jgi:hypothetical protein
MPRQKKKNIEQENIEEEFEKVNYNSVEESILGVEKPEKKLKEHIVLAWNSSKVYFKLASGHICFTQNIWGTKLVPGDTIYLEE